MAKNLTVEDVLSKFQAYVANDYEGAAEREYIQEALSSAGIDESNADDYGFGWVFD